MPVGVRERNGKLQIAFSKDGQECRISLGIEASTKNIEYSEQLRNQILFEIKIGAFTWEKHFPKSKQALQAATPQSNLAAMTVKDRLVEFYERHERPRLASSTNKTNASCISQTIEEFGHHKVLDLRTSDIAAFVQIRSKYSSKKTVSNILIPLSNMYKEIENDTDHINPVARLNMGLYYTKKNEAKRPKSNRTGTNPFTVEQIKQIILAAEGQCRNILQFFFYTGVRTGEAIALEWQDIDFETQTVVIRHSKSVEEISSTKVGKGRILKLLPPALDALYAQKEFTGKLGQFVFHDPRKKQPWQDDQAIRKKAWVPALKAAQITYRNPYQTRHSFATMLLMAREDPRFVVSMLGHSSLEMVNKHYGCVLPDKDNINNYKMRNSWDSLKEDEDE